MTVKQSSSPLTLLTINWHNCTTVRGMIIAKSLNLRHPTLSSIISLWSHIFTFSQIRCGLGYGWFCKNSACILRNKSVAWYKVELPPVYSTNALLTAHPRLLSQRSLQDVAASTIISSSHLFTVTSISPMSQDVTRIGSFCPFKAIISHSQDVSVPFLGTLQSFFNTEYLNHWLSDVFMRVTFYVCIIQGGVQHTSS